MTNSVPEPFYIYNTILAGIPVRYCFRYPETIRYFTDKPEKSKSRDNEPYITVSEQMLSAWAENGMLQGGYAEFCLSCMPVSEFLLSSDRCVFHAAAVRWRDRAYLISAGSGVGKSTQCKPLIEQWPKEFSVINVDKPILECRKDGSIFVHPSPWNGKEGWHGAEAAPLAGIIFLRRGEKNEIHSLQPSKAAALAFRAVFQSYTQAFSRS